MKISKDTWNKMNQISPNKMTKERFEELLTQKQKEDSIQKHTDSIKKAIKNDTSNK